MNSDDANTLTNVMVDYEAFRPFRRTSDPTVADIIMCCEDTCADQLVLVAKKMGYRAWHERRDMVVHGNRITSFVVVIEEKPT